MLGEGARHRAVIAAAVAAVALVAVVAASARVPLATEGSGSPHFRATQPPSPTERPESRLPTGGQEPTHVPGTGSVSVIVQGALIASALTLLLIGGRALAVRLRRPKERQLEPEPPPERPTSTAPAMVGAVDEGLDALAEGTVDDVVIACWVRLEDAAAAAGVARHASETSSELASRVLADLHAPPLAVDRLLSRYRTARYSRHPLGEDDRRVAIRSLEDIRSAIVGAAP